MKRIKRRAAAVLVLAALILVGLGYFLARLAENGSSWAMYRANASVYTDGILDCGILTDRDGLILARMGDGEHHYADDETVRISCLHAVGDFLGYIGSGALTVYAGQLAGYSFWEGTTAGGQTVALSLDADLQTTAWTALAGRSGAVLVLDYTTGEILCMVSSPAYDPNGEADTSLDGVYVNRCTGASFTPGSVFKLVTLAAALDTIPDLETRRFTCHQTLEMDGGTIRCTGWHGEQTIEQALANSCNCAFGELARELGPEVLEEYAQALGVAGSLTLDGVSTAAGQFLPAETGTADLAWSGIGQYEDLVTPYAMARLCAAIANGGQVREPTLLLGQDNGLTRLLSEETAEALGDYMNYDVVYSYGRDRFPGLDLCAKTGTAEVGGGATHAWFVGYLQSGAPLAFAVVLEKGGGGLIQAGAVANTVLQKASEIYSQ